jgi:hypothetical protein
MRHAPVILRRTVPALVLGGLSLRAQVVVVGLIVAVLVAGCWTIMDSDRSERLAMLIRAMRGTRSPPRRGGARSPSARSRTDIRR